MTFVEALKAARKRIANQQDVYICSALDMIGASEHKARIHDMLDGCNSYGAWLGKHYPKIARDMWRHEYRAGRLQWIDHMIEQELKP